MDENSINVTPEPWEYNPSVWSQRLLVVAFASLAALIAIYMGLYQWKLIDTIWDPVFKEQTALVLDSALSHQITGWIKIPDAMLGALAYIGDILFALAGSERRWHDRPWLVILFGLDVIPLGIVSVILVFSQGLIVGSWCFLCIVTALISMILIFLAYREVAVTSIFLYRVWKRSKNFSLVWHTFWGRPSHLAHKIGSEMAQKDSWR